MKLLMTYHTDTYLMPTVNKKRIKHFFFRLAVVFLVKGQEKTMMIILAPVCSMTNTF